MALRWSDCPARTSVSHRGRIIALLAAGCGIVLIALAQPFVESNAEWRVPGATCAFSAVAITLAAAYLAGGTAWLRHFAFPMLFFLIAVPWPSVPESRVMSFLMNHNAQACVEALQWMGFEASQRGNLISLPSGILEVEEACSGIRSLQSGIMVSLLFGEFFRLRVSGRILLVLTGLGAALVGNALRTLALAWIASGSGTQSVAAWHDPAGFAILLSTMATVGIVGRLLSLRLKHEARAQAGGGRKFPMCEVASWRPAALAICGIWLLALAGTEVWYRVHDVTGMQPANAWTFSKRAPQDGVQAVPISAATYGLLNKPDISFSEQWADEDGLHWRAFFFRWGAGHTAIELQMTGHDPRFCLRSMGMVLRKTYAPGFVEAAGFRIPFRKYLFYDGSYPLYVFHAVVKDESDDRIPFDGQGDYTTSGRLRWVLAGRRSHGLKVLEIAVWGASDLADAERRLRGQLEKRVKPTDGARKPNVGKIETAQKD